MNVVKKVANTVRRPAVFQAGMILFTHKIVSQFHIHAAGSSGQSLLADPEREPFHYEIQQQALHYLMPGVQSTIEEKIQGKVVENNA